MIPVFEPEIGELEIAYVTEALRKGEISGSFGQSIPQFEREFGEFVGARYAMACTSGSTALQMAVAAAGIGPGDEVLVSASTNIATALAVTHNGAIPVSVDSERETWNLDLDLIEGLITAKTKAIIPVHLFGHPVDMDRLMVIAKKHHLIVVEDCAESHGASVRGKMTGSFGHMSCFSFYANKIITTGEGGMVLTDDPILAEKLRLLRNLGFTKPRFRHEIRAFNFRMTGYQAAMGLAQMKRLPEFVEKKRALAQQYNHRLSRLPAIKTPAELDWAKNVYWMYAITVDPSYGVSRDKIMAELESRGIETRTFFCPMNIQPCFQDLKDFVKTSCPVAEEIWNTGLYLPSSTKLSLSEIESVTSAIAECFR